MILRTLAIVDTPELATKLRELWPYPESELDFVESQEALWSSISERGADLVVMSGSALMTSPGSLVEALRELPDPAELVVLAGADSRSSDYLAGGVLAVIEQEAVPDKLRHVFESILQRIRETLANRLQVEKEGSFDLGDFSSESQEMGKVLALARKVAASDSSVLVLGETGVGKEYLSRAIHAAGDRASGPFVAVNCAAIPDSLLESELFGHEKGAFTGAHDVRRGHFELAHGGTLFLDEIGEMPLMLQTKLLRVLQEKCFRRLGGEQEIHVDTRIIAATNRDPKAAIVAKELREDLYYRLAVVSLRIPPLRVRRADIPVLFESHVEHFRAKLGRWEIEGVSAAAMKALVQYAWPGNVRELINVAERAVLLGDGPLIGTADLPQALRPAVDPTLFANEEEAIPDLLDLPLEQARSRLLEHFETEYFSRLLTRNRGSVGKTAEQAGITSRTLYNRLKQLGLRREDFKSQS